MKEGNPFDGTGTLDVEVGPLDVVRVVDDELAVPGRHWE